jgi:hypothetical protein
VKRFFILCGLVLPQVACNAEESVLHIRYQEKKDISAMIDAGKKTCEEVLKRKFEIVGNTDLMGVSRVDEYWSSNGFHVIYRMDYAFGHKSAGGDACRMVIVPKMKVMYEDFHANRQYSYNRKYKNWDESAANPWAALDALQGKGPAVGEQGDIGSERWNVKETPAGISKEMVSAMRSVGWGPLVDGGKVVGKDKVAGHECTVYKPNVFGSDDTVCMWKPGMAGLPNEVALKGSINLNNVAKLVSVAKKVDLNASVPASLLRAPVEWQNKATGHYEKSEKTNNEWLDSKQLRALKKAKSRK